MNYKKKSTIISIFFILSIQIFLLINNSFISAMFFGIHLCLVLCALVTLVYELAVSFEALTEHLDIMRTLKDKF